MPAHPDLIDRDDLVLLVIDAQAKLVAAMERRDAVGAAIARVVRMAALVGVPVVVTRQYPAGLGDTVAQVGALSEAATSVAVTVVDKTAFCACDEPTFLPALEALGRRQVAITGMETHICVVQTALALTAHGFRVHVVDDACCSRSDRDHDIALARLRTQRVTVTSSESVMYEAMGRAGTDEFRRLLAIVKAG